MCAYIKLTVFIYYISYQSQLHVIEHLPQGLSTQDYSENLYFHHYQMSEASFKTLAYVDCLSLQLEVGSGVQLKK